MSAFGIRRSRSTLLARLRALASVGLVLAPQLPALKGPTPLLDRLSTVGDAPQSTKLTS